MRARNKGSYPPLLITSAVNAKAPHTTLSDPGERLRLTLAALRTWLASHPHASIVVCDGSGFDLAPYLTRDFPDASIESLVFEVDRSRLLQQGKGWGEGEIVKYSLHTSTFLRETCFFAKCTSKLYVNNFDRLVSKWNGTFQCDGSVRLTFVPSIRAQLVLVDTRFYMVSKQTYHRLFAEAHQLVQDPKGHWLEHCFTDIVVENKLRHFLFPVKPEIYGVSGSTGAIYSSDTRSRLKQILKRQLIGMTSNLLSRGPGLPDHEVVHDQEDRSRSSRPRKGGAQ